jgi:uncharacterized protein YndB with AHSA1/START domain
MDLEAKVELKVLKPLSEVFEGVIDPKKMANYFITDGSSRMDEGKTVTWTFSDYGKAKLQVHVKNVEKDKSISYVWSASGVETVVNMKFTPVNPTTTSVKITESGWTKDDKGIARLVQQTHGWVHFLCGLKAFLEHGVNIRIGAF